MFRRAADLSAASMQDELNIAQRWFDCAERIEAAHAAPGQKVVWFLNAPSQVPMVQAATIRCRHVLTVLLLHRHCAWQLSSDMVTSW